MRHLNFALLGFLLVCLSACNGSGDIQKLLDDNKDEIDQLTDASVDELKKLRQIEYKVVEFSSNKSPTAIGQELSALGKERWDCFHSERSTSGSLVFYCKRAPKSLLRYIPKELLGR